MDSATTKMWDIQPKGERGGSRKAIGKELDTFYKNYLSDFIFNQYMLFMGEVSSKFRRNQTKNTFFIEHLKDDDIKKDRRIKRGMP